VSETFRWHLSWFLDIRAGLMLQGNGSIGNRKASVVMDCHIDGGLRKNMRAKEQSRQ